MTTQYLSNFSQQFEPTETFMDPVSKIRVSNPENMIDTDFEYGLQSSKWETLELNNNIPSFYVSDSDAAIPNLVSVASTSGSNIVTVTTEESHGLVQGTPIDVKGLSSRTAEGKFLIKTVPSETSFTFEAQSPQTTSGNLGNIYTTITPGQFYSGSQIPFKPDLGIISNGTSPNSALIVTTEASHGFRPGSSFYLVNSVGSKQIDLDETFSATAPDGRPYVDFADTITKTLDINESLTETKQMRSTYYIKINASNVSTATERITWPNHGLRENDTLLYIPSANDAAIGGLERFQVYYVKSPTTNNFQLGTSFASSTPVNLTSAGAYSFGRGALHLVYELRRVRKRSNSYVTEYYTQNSIAGTGSGWDLTERGAVGLGNKLPTSRMVFSPSGYALPTTASEFFYSSSRNASMIMPESATAPGVYNFIEDYERYRTYRQFNTSQVQFNGNFWSATNDCVVNTASFNANVDQSPLNRQLFFMYLEQDEEADTFYSEDHGLETGNTISVSFATGENVKYSTSTTDLFNTNSPGDFSGTTTVQAVSSNRFKLVFPGNTTRLYSARGTYNMTGAATNALANSFYFPNHGWVDNDELFVDQSTGTLPASTTGNAVFDTRFGAGNLFAAWKILDSYMTDYTTALSGHRDILLNGTANSTQPITTGVATGTSLLTRFSTTTLPFLKSHYRLQEEYSPNNDMYLHRQSSTAVKDAATGTAFSNSGWGYIGTDFRPSRTVPHYSLCWGVALPNVQDVTEFRNYSRLFATALTSRVQNNVSYTVAGNSNWRASYAARFGTDATAAGYVELNVAIWNLGWTPETDAGVTAIAGTNDNDSFMIPTSGFTSSNANKPLYFRTLFMLDPGTTFNSASVDALVSGMVSDFGTSFVLPTLADDTQISVRVVNNNRFVLRSLEGFDYNLSSTGTAPMIVSKQGVANANDGTYSIEQIDSDNTFILRLPYVAPPTPVLFNAASVTGNIITTSIDHFFVPGAVATYENNGNTSISGLTDGANYFVIVYDENNISLATTYDNALRKIPIPISSGTGSHAIITSSVSGRIAGQGLVTVTAGSKKIKGNSGTLFKRYFKVGDIIGIKNTTPTPNQIESFVVAAIADDQTMELDALVPFSSEDTSYFLETKLYARPDGYSAHRSFDGGVEIAAGTAPLSQIVRQTRKYFRYQSGKGIQNSLAVNFNPPVQFERIEAVSAQTVDTGTLEYSVTADGTTNYLFNGVADPSITLRRGTTYTFNMDTAGQPLFFQTSVAPYNASNVYTDGVINGGVASGTISFTVPESAPNTLYYVSQNSAAMTGTITITDPVLITTSKARVTTRYPHRLNLQSSIRVSGSEDPTYNGTFGIANIIDDFSFEYNLTNTPISTIPAGIVQFNMNGYQGASLRAGMFDFQNGFFFEFDGTTLYCVRRSSTQQISGDASVNTNSNIVRGVNTNFVGQLAENDMIVIRGGSYKVTKVVNRTEIHIQPQYKGISTTNAIVTKTIDTKVPQSEWSIDACDGDGVTGYNLNINKIQMAYMDYSWYGAGKIRFGFKDNDGHVKYVHEFLHNNLFDEAYMRSGNLPGRYEVVNGPTLSYAPTLFHWGTSVIMDGTFDDDKAYLFTADSNSLSFTNGQQLTASTNAASQLTSVFNSRTRTSDWYLRLSFASTESSKISAGSKLYTADEQLNGQIVSYTQFSGSTLFAFILLQNSVSAPAVFPVVGSGASVFIGEPPVATETSVNLGTDIIPLMTIRLAPSADNSITGNVGAREIINRMQLKLNEIGMILTHDCEVKLILNGDLSTVEWNRVSSPSLSQLIRHESGDRVLGGVEIFSFRAAGGSVDNTGKRLSGTSNFSLGDIIDMGNSILGGDGTFPNGPDILTVAVRLVDTAGIGSASPFTASSRITWAESQA
jgi:hypothetical protein